VETVTREAHKIGNRSVKSATYVLKSIAASIVAYYLITSAFPKLIVTEANYTEYYWFRAPWLFLHVFTGITTTVLGPFQFITRVRVKHLALHRLLGKVYIYSVVVAAVTANYLAATTSLNSTYSIGLSVGAVIWLVTTAMALYAIKCRNIDQHKEWMTRSYVISLFFILYMFLKDISFRLGLPAFIGSELEARALLVWASWSIPLFMTEFFLQNKKISKR
jgi:uncharacterized membrane protein